MSSAAKGLLALLAVFCVLVGLLSFAKTRPASAEPVPTVVQKALL